MLESIYTISVAASLYAFGLFSTVSGEYLAQGLAGEDVVEIGTVMPANQTNNLVLTDEADSTNQNPEETTSYITSVLIDSKYEETPQTISQGLETENFERTQKNTPPNTTNNIIAKNQVLLSEKNSVIISLNKDSPRKLPDGTIFMPISAQRVFNFRTEIGSITSAIEALTLPGKVTVRPNASFMVQAAHNGIFTLENRNYIFEGQSVKKGDVLGILQPTLTLLERADIDSRIQHFTNAIDMLQKRIERLEEVYFVRYRRSRMEQLRIEMEGNRSELKILVRAINKKFVIRSTIDGFVSDLPISSGEYVETGQTLAEIINPTDLRVTAYSFDSTLAQSLPEAYAETMEGIEIKLKPIGAGRMMANQNLPIHFEISSKNHKLIAGVPVIVNVQIPQANIKGIRVPKESINVLPSGQKIIWERLSSEKFLAHHVETMSVNLGEVMITTDLGRKMRLVVHGTNALNQIN